MPLWSKNGRERLYWADTKRMAVAIEAAPAFKPGIPKVLFERSRVFSNFMQIIGIPWDISPDGKRFLMARIFLEHKQNEGSRAEQVMVIRVPPKDRYPTVISAQAGIQYGKERRGNNGKLRYSILETHPGRRCC